jgi:hypothetical protein
MPEFSSSAPPAPPIQSPQPPPAYLDPPQADLADPALGHTHLPAPVQSVIDWRGGYLPAFLAGLAMMALGLFMPWVSIVAAFVGQIDLKGLDTADGKVFGVGILILAAVAYAEARSSKRYGRIVLLVGALGLAGLVCYEYVNLTDGLAEINDEDFGRAGIGYGLYICGAGAAIATIAAALRLRKRN